MGNYVMAAVDDIFFAAKIRAAAEELGVEVRIVKSADAALAMARGELPTLIIADLHSEKCDPFRLAEQIKSDPETRTVPLLGFFSHVMTEYLEKAKLAGYDRVMPRSAFSKQLAEILSHAARSP